MLRNEALQADVEFECEMGLEAGEISDEFGFNTEMRRSFERGARPDDKRGILKASQRRNFEATRKRLELEETAMWSQLKRNHSLAEKLATRG
eukprot:4671115-Karenia_brevis.AAC.1